VTFRPPNRGARVGDSLRLRAWREQEDEDWNERSVHATSLRPLKLGSGPTQLENNEYVEKSMPVRANGRKFYSQTGH
jgi:hypothetical protein